MAITLFERAINGNKKALRELLKRESEFIYRLAFLHTKYDEDAKIILKNTVGYIYENINKLSKHNNFEKYVMKITIKHINEYLSEFGIIDNESKNIEIIKEDGTINLYYGIDILENHLKNTIILRYFYDMSYEEIGSILDLNESTVKLYIRKSLKIMIEELKGEFQNEKQAR